MHSSNFRMSLFDHRCWLSHDAITSLGSVPTNFLVVQTPQQELKLLSRIHTQLSRWFLDPQFGESVFMRRNKKNI